MRESNHESSGDHQFEMGHSSVVVREVPRDIEESPQGATRRRRSLKSKEHVFRAGQPRRSLFLMHAGSFKTCLTSVDGREKITGFRMRGDMPGLDPLGMDTYTCDAIALDTGEAWKISHTDLCGSLPEFEQRITSFPAAEIRGGWN